MFFSPNSNVLSLFFPLRPPLCPYLVLFPSLPHSPVPPVAPTFSSYPPLLSPSLRNPYPDIAKFMLSAVRTAIAMLFTFMCVLYVSIHVMYNVIIVYTLYSMYVMYIGRKRKQEL
uniref:Uncharacterized protein n=1 Tax=Cacopsylla melanoneura TaxID=428564 RepID=A0A8D8ZFM6_9HEMI